MGWNKRNIIRTAKDLCYPKEVIARLRKAKAEELPKIMMEARLAEIRKEDIVYGRL